MLPAPAPAKRSFAKRLLRFFERAIEGLGAIVLAVIVVTLLTVLLVGYKQSKSAMDAAGYSLHDFLTILKSK